MEARLAIFTCDEFGESHSANAAIIEAIERGLAGRYPVGATLQMPAPWAPGAARYAASRPDADVGVHLTIECRYRTMGFRPLCVRNEVPGLYAPDGCMWETAALAWQHAGEDEIYGECRAQVEAALSLGVDVSHLDGHGGFQALDMPEKWMVRRGRGPRHHQDRPAGSDGGEKRTHRRICP